MTNREAIEILKESKSFGRKVSEIIGTTSKSFENEQEALEVAIKVLEKQEEEKA